MQRYHFLLLKKWKITESAQLCSYVVPGKTERRILPIFRSFSADGTPSAVFPPLMFMDSAYFPPNLSLVFRRPGLQGSRT